ncbi:MAG: hypothetical protein GX815_11180 [Clostridiales bacterium]|nr:hypothetical protein [Clostridiales bacterium]
MIAQLNFISHILRDIEDKQQLFAADILLQLYRCDSNLTMKDLISFFSNKNIFLVWETIMTLKDLDYIKKTIKENSESNIPESFLITENGIAKVQMIQACFQVGNLNNDFHTSPNSKPCS